MSLIVPFGPLLRSLSCTGTSNLFGNIAWVVLTLYLVNELKLEPAVIGSIWAVGSLGALLGALIASRVAKRFGLGLTIIGSAALGFVYFLIPLAGGPWQVSVPLLITAMFLNNLANTVYNINQVSLRQAITPDRLQGRMNASMRFVIWGTIPLGSLLGGFLGEVVGLRNTLWIGAAGTTLAFLWVLLSPVRHLRVQPKFDQEETDKVEAQPVASNG